MGRGSNKVPAVASISSRGAVRKQGTVAQLLAYAKQENIVPLDLDETIYEITNNNASHAVNADEVSYDEAHDDADGEAAEINNEGLERQLEVILDAYGAVETQHILEGIADE